MDSLLLSHHRSQQNEWGGCKDINSFKTGGRDRASDPAVMGATSQQVAVEMEGETAEKISRTWQDS